MPAVAPYKRSKFPEIQGNERLFFENEFRKIEECLRAIIDALIGSTVNLTIASDTVTLPSSSHGIIILTVDTEAAAATDNLATINGGKEGQIVVVRQANDARDVTVKDGTGNMSLAGDCIFTDSDDTITLILKGTTWLELARSNNA